MLAYYVKLGWRHIGQTPVLSGLIVLAIALGIGVSMTMISFYQALAFNPAKDINDRLFAVQLAVYGEEAGEWGMDDGLPQQLTHMDVINIRSNKLGYRQTAMYKIAGVIESQRDNVGPTMKFETRIVDSNFFTMFGLEFDQGQAWDAAVDIDTAYQVVIDERVNNWVFGGGNNIGKTLVMNDGSTEFTVVGIVKPWNPQPGFYDLTGSAFNEYGPGIFLPYSLTASISQFPQGNISGWKATNIRNFDDLLKSEYIWELFWVELPDQAAEERYLNYLNAYVAEQKKLGRATSKYAKGGIKDVETWLKVNQVVDEDNGVMVGLSLLFLLVCLVNTVGLLLAKFLKKMNEAGVRRALGANKWQIFNQYLVEVALLGVLGGVAGILLSVAGLWMIRVLYETDVARLDVSLILAAVGLSIFASILTGVFPAYRVCSANPAVFLKAQ